MSLAVSSLRARWVGFLSVCIAVATGVAVVTACGFLLEAGIRGGTPPERLAGSDIVVAGRQRVTDEGANGVNGPTDGAAATVTERRRLDATIIEDVRVVSGVADAVGDRSFRAYVVGRDGDPVLGPNGSPSWGHAWSSATFTPFDLVEGRKPIVDGDVVIDSQIATSAELGVGDRTSIVAAGTKIDATVVGVAGSTPGLEDQAAVFFSAGESERLYAHPGEIDLIGVTVASGLDVDEIADQLRQTLGPDIAVLTGDDRGRAEFLEAATAGSTLIAISAVLGGISTFVAMFVIAAMLNQLVQQRRSEIALLRAIAATPRQVRRLISRETMIVTALGATIGLAPGVWLGRWIIDTWQARGILPGSLTATTVIFR